MNRHSSTQNAAPPDLPFAARKRPGTPRADTARQEDLKMSSYGKALEYSDRQRITEHLGRLSGGIRGSEDAIKRAETELYSGSADAHRREVLVKRIKDAESNIDSYEAASRSLRRYCGGC
jgi:hypothetical protein